jgi:DNA repair exonuclease SbcCD ATPase subunit
MINILKNNIKKFTHIIHVADIHVRLNSRHLEYEEVFSKLYDEIKKTPETTIVALLGDIFHNKSDLSPECIQMAYDLFTNVANLRPTILVAGNHDATLSNKNRLDSLTPIVDALNHPNLYYLKNTGLYGMGNILFNNMGIFDLPETYTLGKDIPNIYRNQYEHIVALFHGPVDRASLDSGYSISNPAIMNPLFDYNDMALLGDIHKRQDMQEYDSENHKPCIHYVGSLVMQNHGESLKNHGYSLWDLEKRNYTFHEIENSFGYFTVEIHNGKLETSLDNLPSKVHLRVKSYDSNISEIKTVIAFIKEKSQIVETSIMRMDQDVKNKNIIPLCKDIILNDLTNVNYQNNLIKEFITQRLGIINSKKINDILKINLNTNSLIKRDEFSRNLKWKPIRFEWDNMFTYGEGNVIDFTHMNGVYGIFGPNKCGKSSILSALIFCLFDKFDRGFKGSSVLNIQKTSFKCKLELEISGTRYFIEREGNTTKTGNVKVDVHFWKLVNGEKEELHGTDRRDTNDIIRDYVGTYEDFIITSASFQTAKNQTSFIDMGNSERKDLLVQFLGLNVFDRLHESAGERNKELCSILKLHKDKNYQYEIQQNENFLIHAESTFSDINNVVNSLQKQISDVNNQIIAETSNMIKLDSDVPTNISVIKNRKLTAEETLKNKNEYIKSTKEKLNSTEGEISKINDEIGKIESSNLTESHKTYKLLTDKISNLKQKIDLKKVEIKGKLEKVSRLEKHEYDPNCKFCVNNSFVKDAMNAKTELVNDKKETDKILVSLDEYNIEFEKFKWVEETYEKYTKLLTDRNKLKDICSNLSKNIIISTNELEKLNTSYNTIIHQIELYQRNEAAVEVNNKIQSTISTYRNALSKLNEEFQKQNKMLMEIAGKRELFKSNIEQLTNTLRNVTSMEDEYDSYQQYLMAVGRDGIPYQVICNTVPEIEKEVNAILNQVADYTIEIETDGKNLIPYIVYSHGRWPIELTSGYERFVASIAIRIALTNISNLPKTNGLYIDEGFGTLDSDNLACMYPLFSFLKNNFDFIVIISHLDTLKDSVDKQIEILKNGDMSNVVFQ